jgi:tetratricopeptide (TPR) repeat protein
MAGILNADTLIIIQIPIFPKKEFIMRKYAIILFTFLFFTGCAMTPNGGKLFSVDIQSAGKYNRTGNEYFSKGQYDRAISAYKKAIKAFPRYAKAHSNLGYALFEINKYDRAIEAFSLAIEYDPKYSRAYNNRGLVYFAKGEYSNAVRDYNKAIEIEPALAKPYDNRGTIYMLTGDEEKACADFLRACDLGECATFEVLQDNGLCNSEYLAMADRYQAS